MAEPKNVSFDGVMKELKQRIFAPIYYLMGDEAYYIDLIADYIAENVLNDTERDFNQTILYGPDVTMAQVVDIARRYPMMAEHQVIIVKEAQGLNNYEALEAYLNNPQSSTILVFCHKNGSLDKRKRVAAMVASVGVLFESKKLRERDLPTFIERYLRERGVEIENKSLHLIADDIGPDLHRLTSELDKLVLALDNNNRIVTPEVVEKQIGVSKDFNGFELRDALVNKNIFKANQIVKYFDENPRSGGLFALMPLIYKFFQNLLIAHYCPQKDSPEALAKWLELKNSWATKDYLTGMRNYNAMKVVQIISKIREIDAKSKGLDNPNTPQGELLSELIYFILH